jgi:competence protein ComFC
MAAKTGELLLRLIFPPKCIMCDEVLIIDTPFEICDKCDREFPYTSDIDSLDPVDFYDEFYCLGRYEGILKKAIIDFKFFEKPYLYRTLGDLLFRKLSLMTNDVKFDIIVSVPMPAKRKRARGYNQAYLLAKSIGKHYSGLVSDKVLKRIKETESQKGLDKAHREKNLEGAFEANSRIDIKGKEILLIDDIMTTGTTLRECSRALKIAGASKVTAAVIASGRGL